MFSRGSVRGAWPVSLLPEEPEPVVDNVLVARQDGAAGVERPGVSSSTAVKVIPEES